MDNETDIIGNKPESSPSLQSEKPVKLKEPEHDVKEEESPEVSEARDGDEIRDLSWPDEEDNDDSWEDEDDGSQYESSDGSLNLNRLAELCAHSDEGTKDVPPGSDVVLVIGRTGAGKSTFMQNIIGHKFSITRDKNGKYEYNLDGEGNKEFGIGKSTRAHTSNLQSFFCEESTTYFVDTPGFEDTRAIEIDIATSLGIKSLCARAKRIRFVALINAHAFHLDRSRELRSVLDHVHNFIGDNFRTYKHCFTFLFTHCSTGLNSIKGIDLVTATAEKRKEMLIKGRTEIRNLLREVWKGTREQNVKELSRDLAISIMEGKPYCSILDPILTDITHLKSIIVPAYAESGSEQFFLLGEEGIVRINMTKDSKLLLVNTLEARQNSIAAVLESGVDKISEENTKNALEKDALAICKLRNFIGLEYCTIAVSFVLESLQKTIMNKREDVGNYASKMEEKKLRKEDSEKYANLSKINTEHVAFLDGILQECVLYLQENIPDTFKLDDYSSTGDLFAVIENSFAKVVNDIEQGLISSNEKLLGLNLKNNDDEPIDIDFEAFSEVGKNLSVWAKIFGNQLEARFVEFLDGLRTKIYTTSESFGTMLNEQDTVLAKSMIAIKGVKYFHEGDKSGLFQICSTLREVSSMFFEDNEAENHMEQFKTVINDLYPAFKNMIMDQFEKYETNEKGDIDQKVKDLSEAFQDLVSLQNFIRRSDIVDLFSDVQPLPQAISILDGIIEPEIKACESAMETLDSQEDSLKLCNKVNGIVDCVRSLPKNLTSGNDLRSRVKDLLKDIDKNISAIHQKLEMATESIKGNVSDEEIEQHISELNSSKYFLWFDKIMESTEYLGNYSLAEKHNHFLGLYEEAGKANSLKIIDEISDILNSNTLSDEGTLQKARNVISAMDLFENIDYIFKSTETELEISILPAQKTILKWASRNKHLNMTNTSSQDDIKYMHRLLLVSKSLSGSDHSILAPLTDQHEIYLKDLEIFLLLSLKQ